MDKLRRAVRDVPDFPKKGIVFKDITPILQDGKLLKRAMDTLAGHYRGKGITKVLGA